jgi:hypothetical protein
MITTPGSARQQKKTDAKIENIQQLAAGGKLQELQKYPPETS